MPIHKPSWFTDDKIMVSTAPTCGLTKGGRILPLVDTKTGSRTQVPDPDTGELVDAINDKLLEYMTALSQGNTTDTLRFINREIVSLRSAVPVYYDRRFDEAFQAAMETDNFRNFTAAKLVELLNNGMITIKGGHGSPSQEQRIGHVPYIKVSDLRAGLVNINPTNRVPLNIAKRHWRGDESGLQAFDLLCPERTSKNIGDFCVLMPGQERVLLTKEIIVMRPGPNAYFDSFFLLWAMTLKIVREQWKRIIFMQTNREDVGKRYLEISIPIPRSKELSEEVSEPFRNYFTSIANARTQFATYLARSEDHHFFVSGAELPEIGDDAAIIEELASEADDLGEEEEAHSSD
jgi:type I restriction enzyme M protein